MEQKDLQDCHLLATVTRVSPASALPAAILEKYVAQGVTGENFREQARRGYHMRLQYPPSLSLLRNPPPSYSERPREGRGLLTTPIEWFRFSLNDLPDRRETS